MLLLLRRSSVRSMSRVRSALRRPPPVSDPPKPAHTLELSIQVHRAETLRCPAAEMFYFYFQVRPCPAGWSCIMSIWLQIVSDRKQLLMPCLVHRSPARMRLRIRY